VLRTKGGGQYSGIQLSLSARIASGWRNNHEMQTSEPSIESGLPSVFASNGVSTMYNNFSVLFIFPTVYRCASATQVDACRPRFYSGIYWRVGMVAKLQCTLEFPPPTPLFCWILPLGSYQTMLRKCNKTNITYLGPVCVCVCVCVCETDRLLTERHREIGEERKREGEQ